MVMVEKNPEALKALRENASRLRTQNLTIVPGDALEFARGTTSSFNFVFVDPPFRLGLQAVTLASIRGLLVEGGRAYVESDAAFDPPRGWTSLKHARAGRVHFYILRRDPDDQGGVSGNV